MNFDRCGSSSLGDDSENLSHLIVFDWVRGEIWNGVRVHDRVQRGNAVY